MRTFLKNPWAFLLRCHGTNKALEAIRRSLLQKGHATKDIDLLVNRNGFFSFIFLELITLLMRSFVYKYESDFSRTNLPSDCSLVFVSNHYSHVDYLVLYSEICLAAPNQMNPMALASSHLNKGIFGFLFRRSNVAFVHRNKKNDFSLLEDFLAEISQHRIPLILFPEGTFSVNGNLKSFKKGILGMMVNLESFRIIPTKLQTTRTFGDLNYATIRRTHKWNTQESIVNILKHIRAVLAFKGIMRVRLGQIMDCKGPYDELVLKLKKSIESLAVYGALERDIYAIYLALKSGGQKAQIESLGFAEFSFIEKVFEWRRYDEKALESIFYFSVNHFIYEALSAEERTIYERAFHYESQSEDFAGLNPLLQRHFQEISASFRLS